MNEITMLTIINELVLRTFVYISGAFLESSVGNRNVGTSEGLQLIEKLRRRIALGNLFAQYKNARSANFF